MYAMLLARFKMFPEVKEKGMSSVPRLVAFTSEHVGVYVSLQLRYLFWFVLKDAVSKEAFKEHTKQLSHIYISLL